MSKAENAGTGCNVEGCAAKTPAPRESREDLLDRQAIARRMCRIEHKILVLSGKGGVGKSTIAVNLAVSLAMAGKRVGLLDVDVHGPSVPRLLGLEGRPVEGTGAALLPVQYAPTLKVMSIGFLLERPEEAVIWRGPMKFSCIRQFLRDVEWGELDYLIVDSPPGTGDEPMSIVQLLPETDGAVVVTTPQDLSVADVRRCIGFCRQVGLRVLGVIENMSGLICPHCGETIDLFKQEGGKRMAREMGVAFLGSLPIDPQIADASDAGRPYARHFAGTETARAFERIVAPILALDRETGETPAASAPSRTGRGAGTLRIAIPLAQGKLSTRFGHCDQLAIIDADVPRKTIIEKQLTAAPNRQPGLLPRWLREQGVSVVVAGAMGDRARELFEAQDIEVHVGAPGEEPERLVETYLAGILPSGEDVREH